MKTSHTPQSKFAFVMSLSIVGGAVAPLITAQSTLAQTRLSDISGLWAESCITSLSNQGIINGYPDGSFRPNTPVNRAEFATMVATAFPNVANRRSAGQFSDIQSSYWASSAIRSVSQKGFLSGYPDGSFRPTQNIPRAQALIALSSGLGFQPSRSVDQTLNNFADSFSIPAYARNGIAAATEQSMVVNYPTVQNLRPNQVATRADVAAFLCQALKTPQQPSLISSQFIPGGAVASPPRLQHGTDIAVTYREGDRIIVAANETVPINLELSRHLRDANGNIVVRRGSVIQGQLEPRENGSQFVAQSIVINGQAYDFNASSPVITRTTTARDPNLLSLIRNAVLGGGAAAGISSVVGDEQITPAKVLTGAAFGTAIEANQGRRLTSILRDSAIGAAIATGLSSVVGDEGITVENVLSGAASGAAIGGIIDPDRMRVVIIDPDTDLDLTLDRAFTVPN